MERLVAISQQNDILPKDSVFVGLWKFLTKGDITEDSQKRKACVKICNGLSEQDDGIEALVEYKSSIILKTLIKVFPDVKASLNLDCIEDVLEILHVIAEFSESGNSMLFNLSPDILEIVNGLSWKFSVRLEACKLFNLLVESVASLTKDFRECKPYNGFVESFGKNLESAGDYELQATLMEALFRLVTAEEKMSSKKHWFSTVQLQNSFMAIRNEQFETDCRRFLNQFNESLKGNQKVFSFPISTFNLGRYQLKQPKDSKITDFWFDFNLESKTLSTFVNDESSTEESPDWEMVCIKVDTIRDFRVNVNSDKAILILKLYEPAYQLVPFAPQASETYVKVIFKNCPQVIAAITKIFGHIKYVELPISSPSISSTPAKHITGKASSAVTALNIRDMKKFASINNAAQDETVSSSSAQVEKDISEIPVNEEIIEVNNKEENLYISNEKPCIEEVKPQNKPHNVVQEEKEEIAIKDPVIEKPNNTDSTSEKRESKPKHKNETSDAMMDDNVHFSIDKSLSQEITTENKKGKTEARNSQRSHNLDNINAIPNKQVKIPNDTENINKSKAKEIVNKETIKKTRDKRPKEITVDSSDYTKEIPSTKKVVKTSVSFPHEEKTKGMNTEKTHGGVDKENVDGGNGKEKTKGEKNKEKTRKKTTKPDNKRTKKLYRTNMPLFQDSPDDAYKAVPLKHQEINFKKFKPVDLPDSQEEKPVVKKMMKLMSDENVLSAAFDFNSDGEEQESSPKLFKKSSQEETTKAKVTTEDKEKGKKKKTSQKKKTKSKTTKTAKNSKSNGGGADKNKNDEQGKVIATRSSSRLKKTVDYKEATCDHFDDGLEDENSIEPDKRETEVTIEGKEKKSVSFVSPIEERSYYEVESEYSSGSHKNIDNAKNDEGLVLDTKPKHERSPNSKLEEKSRLKIAKQERVAKWAENIEQNVNNEEIEDDNIESLSPSNEKNLPTPTTDNHNDSNDDDNNDDDGSIDLTPYIDTPWSMQKEKKQRIKTEYSSKQTKEKKHSKRSSEKVKSNQNNDMFDYEVNRESCDGKQKQGINSKQFYSKQKSSHIKSKQKQTKHDKRKEKRPKISKYIKISDYEEVSSSQSSSVNLHQNNEIPKCTETELIIEDVPAIEKPVAKQKHFFDCAQSPSTIQKSNKRKKSQAKEKADNSFDSKCNTSIQGETNFDEQMQFNDETPMNSKNSITNQWPVNFKKGFENVDEVGLFPRPIKKKLWKSPVVHVKEDEIPDCAEDEHPVLNMRKLRKSPNVEASAATPKYSKSISQPTTPMIPSQDETTNNFLNFCKNMVEKSSHYTNSIDNESLDDVSPAIKSQTCSPVPKKKKSQNVKTKVHTEPEEIEIQSSQVEKSPSQSPLPKKKKTQPPQRQCVEEKEEKQAVATFPADEAEELPASKKICSPEYSFMNIQTDTLMKKYLTEKSIDDFEDDDSFDTPPQKTHFDIISKDEKPSFQISGDIGNEVQSLLQVFGSNVYKNIDSKRSGLERFIGKLSKILSRKLNAAHNDQMELRNTVDNVFYSSWEKELDEWFTSSQSKQTRLSVVFEQLQKILKENSSEEQKRIKRMRNIVLKYCEKKREVHVQEKMAHSALQDSIRSDIKKLKGNMLRQSKAVEIVNIRRSLQSMLHGV